MAWNLPSLPTAGTTVATVANWATKVIDSLRYLKGLDGAVTLSDALILPDGACYYVHLPGLTTTQRDALTATAGMIIYNTTTTAVNVYENGAWVSRTDLSKMVIASQAQGDIFYASSATAIARLGAGTSGYALKTQGANANPVWAAGFPVSVVKTSDETVNNSDTLQNDDALLLAVGISQKWAFTLFVIYSTGAIPDFKWQLTVPTNGAVRGVRSTAIGESSTGAGGTSAPSIAAASAYVEPHHSTAGILLVTGIYIGGDTAGNMTLQWAQNTAEVSNTKVLANSYLLAFQVT